MIEKRLEVLQRQLVDLEKRTNTPILTHPTFRRAVILGACLGLVYSLVWILWIAATAAAILGWIPVGK